MKTKKFYGEARQMLADSLKEVYPATGEALVQDVTLTKLEKRAVKATAKLLKACYVGIN